MSELIKSKVNQKETSMTLISEVLKDSPNQSLINELLIALDIPISKDPLEQLENIYKHIESQSFRSQLKEDFKKHVGN